MPTRKGPKPASGESGVPVVVLMTVLLCLAGTLGVLALAHIYGLF